MNKTLNIVILFLTNYQYLLLFVAGYFFHHVQAIMGMRNQIDGVAYYAEVHQSKFNSFIHTLFMPFTILGVNILVPAILDMQPKVCSKFKSQVYTFYLGLYAQLSLLGALLSMVWYFIPHVYSSKLYRDIESRYNRIFVGLLITVSALLIQEYFGHYLGGDKASRICAVPNALLYAKFFAVMHWIY